MVALILFFYFLTAVTHLVSWGMHKASLRPDAVAAAMLSMLAICIWHSWIVKGRRQTIAFFLIAWVVSWFCEFIGDNYGWFFGKYKYTGTLGPRVGGVPILIIVTWSVIIYAAFMLIDWLIGLRGVRKGNSWWGKGLWAVLIAAATATLVCAWDMMVDPDRGAQAAMVVVAGRPLPQGAGCLEGLGRRAHRQLRGLVAGAVLHNPHLLPGIPEQEPHLGEARQRSALAGVRLPLLHSRLRLPGDELVRERHEPGGADRDVHDDAGDPGRGGEGGQRLLMKNMYQVLFMGFLYIG
jgi:hypothetical protein